jgi:hypothetical protein
MKNRESVEALCEAPEEQARFLSLSERDRQLSGRLAKTPAMGVILEASKILGESKHAEFDVVSRQLSAVGRSLTKEIVSELLLEEARRFQDCAIYNVAAQVVDAEAFGGLVIYQDANIRVSLVSLTPVAHRTKARNPVSSKPRGITIQGNDSVLHVVAAGDMSIKWWDAEPFGRAAVLDDRSLAPPRSMTIREGETLALEGGRHGMSIADIDKPALFAIVTALDPRVSVNAHYVAETGQLHSFTAAEMKSSRIQLLATLLRELNQGGAEVLQSLLDYPDHFVRWHVMRELLAMEGSRAVPLLDRMVQDDHPQVRDAATRTVALIREGTLCLA